MSAEKSNVHNIDEAREAAVAPEESKAKTRKDMSRMALVVSLLAVVLLVVFFFGLNQNMAGISGQVKGVGELKAEVATLNKRVATLEGLPKEVRNLLYFNMVSEMATTASFIEARTDDPELKKKLEAVKNQLKEIRAAFE